jgi:hypothetical protein
MHLIKTIQSCRSLPDLQQAYSEFWQNAFTQYADDSGACCGSQRKTARNVLDEQPLTETPVVCTENLV